MKHEPHAPTLAGSAETPVSGWLLALLVVLGLAFLLGALALSLTAPRFPRTRRLQR